MIDINKYKVNILSTIFCILLLITAVVFSIKAINSTKGIEKRHAYSIQALQQNLDQLESRIEEIKSLVKENQANLQSSLAKLTISNHGTSQSLKDNTEKEKSENKQEKHNLVTVNADMDQEVLRELYDKAIKEKNLKSQQSILLEINSEQRELDRDLYYDTVEELYRKTLPRYFGNTLSDEEREMALNELLENYPDSYAAAKAISLEAIDSIRENDIVKAEEYYNMLIDLQNAKSEPIILDIGVEAVPAVSYAVAFAYHRNGMKDKIVPIISNLEDNYSDSPMNIRTPNGPRLVSGKEAVDRLRRITGVD